MKRRYRLLLLVLILAAAALWYIKDKSTVTGLFMVFNQNSTQSIMGKLNKAESSALEAVFLSAFQAFAMPWKKFPRVVIAASAVLGFWQGVLLCLLGRLIAAALWYAVGWLALGFKTKRDKSPVLIYSGLSCTLASWGAPLALLCGSLSVPLKYFFAAVCVAQLPSLFFFGRYASIYSTILPFWCWEVIFALSAVLIVLGLIVLIKKKR